MLIGRAGLVKAWWPGEEALLQRLVRCFLVSWAWLKPCGCEWRLKPDSMARLARLKPGGREG